MDSRVTRYRPQPHRAVHALSRPSRDRAIHRIAIASARVQARRSSICRTGLRLRCVSSCHYSFCFQPRSMHARTCWEEAGSCYGVSPYLLCHRPGRIQPESARGQRLIKRAGTYDIGLMQINSSNVRASNVTESRRRTSTRRAPTSRSVRGFCRRTFHATASPGRCRRHNAACTS
jgi:hypothetical protein